MISLHQTRVFLVHHQLDSERCCTPHSCNIFLQSQWLDHVISVCLLLFVCKYLLHLSFNFTDLLENCYYNMVYENRVTIESINPNPFSPNENEIKNYGQRYSRLGFCSDLLKGYGDRVKIIMWQQNPIFNGGWAVLDKLC